MSSWTEAEWDEESHDYVLAADRLARLTGPNGEYLPDATSDGADPTEYTSGYRYVAHGPFTNWAEKMRLDAIDQYKKEAGEHPNLNGLYWTTERIEFEVPSG